MNNKCQPGEYLSEEYMKDSSPKDFGEKNVMINALCHVHKSGSFALKPVDCNHVDIYLLPKGKLIARLAPIYYAYRLVGHLLPFVCDIEKCDFSRHNARYFTGVDAETGVKIQQAIQSAWEEFNEHRRKMNTRQWKQKQEE